MGRGAVGGSLVTEVREVQLRYYRSRSDAPEGVFTGGVKPPEHTDELAIWVNAKERFDPDRGEFDVVDGSQIQITGTRRALFELGRYLVALSEYETTDPDYHDHIEDLAAVRGQPPCELIVRGPRE